MFRASPWLRLLHPLAAGGGPPPALPEVGVDPGEACHGGHGGQRGQGGQVGGQDVAPLAGQDADLLTVPPGLSAHISSEISTPLDVPAEIRARPSNAALPTLLSTPQPFRPQTNNLLLSHTHELLTITN